MIKDECPFNLHPALPNSFVGAHCIRDAWEEYLEDSQLYKLPWKEGKEPDFTSPDISYEGWEIENANLGGSDNAKMLATKELWASEHQNIRDSRLEVFGDLDSGQTVQIVYAARASLGGNYQLPPVEVEAMYDPSIWARAKGGSILVDSPWAGNFL